MPNSVKFGTKKLTNYIEHYKQSSSNRWYQWVIYWQRKLSWYFQRYYFIPAGTGYSRFTVIVTDAVDLTSYQVYDVVILSDGNNNSYILEKSNIKSTHKGVSQKKEKVWWNYSILWSSIWNDESKIHTYQSK